MWWMDGRVCSAAIEVQGYVLEDESYQQSFTIKKF